MHGLKITILEGRTISGESNYFFSSTKTYIVVGCDPDMCDIVFEPTARTRGLGNEHLGFRRSLGSYQLDLNSHFPVSVDGEEPYEDQEITGCNNIQLADAARIQVEVIDTRHEAKLAAPNHNHPGQIAKTNRMGLFGVAALVLVLSGVAIWLFRGMSNVEHQLSSVSDSLTAFESDYKNISTSVIERVTRSTYVVLLQTETGGEALLGTAWVAGDRSLATNAHVVDGFDELKDGQKLLIRSSTPPYTTLEIRSVIEHPGYEAYKELWREYFPSQKGRAELDVMQTISPADVAVVEVAEADAEALAPALNIASLEQLADLRVGTPVAFVGFPAENLVPGSLAQPIPATQQDEIVRITDFFMLNREDGKNRLIQHGLPLTGGASGSPLFAEDGTVIGIISAMNTASSLHGRWANAADINFAQRIDFLHDILAETTDVSAERYIAQWKESLELFERGIETSRSAVKQRLQDNLSLSTPDKSLSLSGNIQQVEPKLGGVGVIREALLEQAGLHLLVVSSNDYSFGVSVEHNGREMPDYAYDIPYGNLVEYQVLVTDEPVELTVELRTRYKKAIDEPLGYRVDVHSWVHEPDHAREQLIIQQTKAKLGTRQAPKLLKELLDVQLEAFEDSKAGYINRSELEFDAPGYYLLYAIPNNRSHLASLLLHGDKLAKKAKKSALETYILHHHAKAETVQMDFIVRSGTEGTAVDIRVYFWPEVAVN